MKNDLESRIYAKADIYQGLLRLQSEKPATEHYRPSQLLHSLKKKDLYGTLNASDVKLLLDELCQETITGSDKALVEKSTFSWGTRTESVYRANTIEEHQYPEQGLKDLVIRQVASLTADAESKAYTQENLVKLICASTYYQVQPNQVLTALGQLVQDQKLGLITIDGLISAYQIVKIKD